MTLTKRYAASALALAAMLGLSGCGSNDTATSEPDTTPDTALTEALAEYEADLDDQLYKCEWQAAAVKAMREADAFMPGIENNGTYGDEARAKADEGYSDWETATTERVAFLNSLPKLSEESTLADVQAAQRKLAAKNNTAEADNTRICIPTFFQQYLDYVGVDLDSLRPDSQ